jgi:hypothetical protein
LDGAKRGRGKIEMKILGGNFPRFDDRNHKILF